MSEKVKDTEEEFSYKCPACLQGTVKCIKCIYEFPDGDKMLLLKFECDKCEFHKSDVIPLETKMEPGTTTLKVFDENDLKSKIYRSPNGTIEIPELELILEPGPAAELYITNIEGILTRFKNAVTMYQNSLSQNDPQRKKIERILEDLQKAIVGKMSFTIKLSDQEGGSYIIPADKSKYSFEKIEYKEPSEKPQ